MFYRRKPRTTKTTTTKPTLMTRLRGPSARTKTVKTTTTTNTPHASHRTTKRHAGPHHHKRKATFGDKVSGAMLKMKGSITRRPGVKAAGTRRMHGTDGRGSHRHVY
ncbi:hypothetical protein N7478_007347 [Penicillium angulare]|uniref:uncharacterized protein n=1 Tax=Penicillium angulare TaxID=116970 RepID=UPI0025422E65|nr:uncharacterized protein N7478_007347 [Penicillium angulare]KAJ5281975.1 hypothetical protein N7478_007347 [Penicillium angulare]